MLETFTKKNFATKFSGFMAGYLSWRSYRNFHNSFFIKNYYLNLNFFSSTAECSPLKQKKSKKKKHASHLKIAWYSKRQKKNIEKREIKLKDEEKSNNNNKYFFTFTFG